MKKVGSLGSLCWTLCTWVVASVALAQQDDDRATAFRAVEGATTEQVPGGSLLIAAYMVALVLLVGYVARVGMLERRTALEVERLSAELSRRASED